MEKRKDTLTRRLRLVLRISDAGMVLLLAGIELGALTGWLGNPLRLQLIVLAAAVLWATERIVLHQAVVNPCRRLRQEDESFTRSEELSNRYSPSQYWTDSQRKVIEKFQKLTDRRTNMELSIEATRYMALQHQINPHFLYNTLDSIRSDMLLAGQRQIAETVEALSRYFAYATSNMEKLATVAEEIGNVRDYFQIQEYRFEERISMKICDELEPDEFQELLIPRLTLQPLVENAISHGIEKAMLHGTVTILLSSTEQNLMIHVQDDGVGMEPAILEQVNQQLNPTGRSLAGEPIPTKRRGGVALGNVNTRIKLLFGENYGLHVHSLAGAGTDISVVVPKVRRGQIDEK